MRPTFMGFETMKTAIFANQKSIDITGNNIANIDTNGYTRQRVERSSVMQSSHATRIASNRVGLAGQGVDTQGVSQIRDSFLDKRFRDEYAKASYHGQAASILDDIQSAIGDGQDITDESGLYGAIKQIMEGLADYTKAPTMDTEANIVLTAFQNMAQVLRQMDAKLTNVTKQHTTDLQVNVDRTNEILSQIAQLNRTISQDATVLTDPNNEHYRPNELLDQRNLLLDELAGYGDISVLQQADGQVSVDMGGKRVVDGSTSDSISMTVNNDQTVALSWRSSGKNVSLTGGSLLGSTDYINGRGHNMQSGTETPNQGIPYYRDQINTFASALTKVANNTIPVLDTTTNKPMVDGAGNIVYKTLLGAKTASGKVNPNDLITAGNISVSDEWTKNGAGYFIYDKNTANSTYAQKLSSQLTDTPYTFNAYGETFTGTFADYEINMLGKLGSDLAFQNGRQEATGRVTDDFMERRDQISGVSQDEETADMLKYQKSYEAAARLMTVLDDLLDVIINRMGRVGL